MDQRDIVDTNTQLPSNRTFGFFFSVLFGSVALYLYGEVSLVWTGSLATVSIFFLVSTLVKPEILLPLNRMWMLFGLFLSNVFSPVVFGLIFFGLFTPIALIMRLGGRDELRLKRRRGSSHWVSRFKPIKSESFKRQF